ncbi:MAG: hypothetical protein ACM33T_02455 [Solirubrobacterales bacterium]
MEHFISRHALEVVQAFGFESAVASGQVRLIIADEDGYDAVLTEHEIAELAAGLESDEEPTAVWQPDMTPWDPPAGYRSPPRQWME